MARHVRLTVLTAAVCLAATSATAQKPPPPSVGKPVPIDRTTAHLTNDRLDHSFCLYPREALRARVEGCCRMSVRISADGRAGKMTGQCTHPVFLAPSEACLAPQSFLPALKKGKPVAAMGDIVVHYVMGKDPSLLDMFRDLFRKPAPDPEPEICKPRPDDLIAGLERLRGG